MPPTFMQKIRGKIAEQPVSVRNSLLFKKLNSMPSFGINAKMVKENKFAFSVAGFGTVGSALSILINGPNEAWATLGSAMFLFASATQQAWSRRHGNEQDLSKATWATYMASDASWLAYGGLIGRLPLVIFNTAAVILRFGVVKRIKENAQQGFWSLKEWAGEMWPGIAGGIVMGLAMSAKYYSAANLFGIAAASLTVAPTISQIVKTLKDGKTKGISYLTQGAFALGTIAWQIYGRVVGDEIIVLATLVNAALLGITLLQKTYYEKIRKALA